jgi:hypothetical protein
MVFGSSLFASSFCGEVREKNSPKIRNTKRGVYNIKYSCFRRKERRVVGQQYTHQR